MCSGKKIVSFGKKISPYVEARNLNLKTLYFAFHQISSFEYGQGPACTRSLASRCGTNRLKSNKISTRLLLACVINYFTTLINPKEGHE